MLANSRAASSSAASAVIGLTAVPAAIDLVDVTIRRKFTTPASIFAPKRHKAQARKGRELRKTIVLIETSNPRLRRSAAFRNLADLAAVSGRQGVLAAQRYNSLRRSEHFAENHGSKAAACRCELGSSPIWRSK